MMTWTLDRLKSLTTPVVSLLFAVLYIGLAAPLMAKQSVRLDMPLVASIVLAAALAVLSAIDLATMRLPNVLTLPLIGAGLAYTAWAEPSALAWRLGSAVLGLAIFWFAAELYMRLRGRMGLGLGDAKLLAASGAWLGAEGLASVVLIAAVAGLAVVLAGKLMGAAMALGTRIPFGPCLAAGTWWVWLYGPIG
jgi:leader peptidase (prepilin peptidase) / N-methyltransferase